MILSVLRATTKAVVLAAYLVLTIPLQWLYVWGGRDAEMRLWWHRGLCMIAGVQAEIVGTPVPGEHVLYVGNHLSHLDVPLLGQHLRATFAAKDEIMHWPFFGWLAKQQKTVFISRDRRDAEKVRNVLCDALRQHKRLVIFPEGTSSPGEEVLPFKSSVFSAFVFKNVTVQPFTLDLIEVDGKRPQNTAERDVYAYYGDMVFMPHLWSFMKRRSAVVRITFHPPLDKMLLMDRKMVSNAAQRVVSGGLKLNPAVR